MPWAKGIHQPPLPPGPFGLDSASAYPEPGPAGDPQEMRAPSHAGVSCRIPPAPRSKTHLALDILTNADVVADLAMRNSVEYRHDTPLAFPLGRAGCVVVQKIDFMMSFSTSSKGKLAPRPQISFCLFSDYSARITSIIVSYQTTRLDSYYTYPATKYMLVQQS